MILDANAANRTMWQIKDWEECIYTDMERKLTVKPTILCDHRAMPFKDATYTTIFHDPPHFYNDKGSFYSIPDAETFKKKWQGYGEIPRYYGGDKYKTQMALLRYLVDAQKEFYRILTNDGLLWLKWNESFITLNTLRPIYTDWQWMLEIPVRLSNPNRTEKQTYWVCMCKKKNRVAQATLI